MNKRAEKLYDGITGISDRIVEQAGTYVFLRKRRRYPGFALMGTLAACACIMVVVVLPHLASGGNSSGSSCGTNMMVQEAETESTVKVDAPAQIVEDSESKNEFSTDGATPESGMEVELGSLFPERILAGYEPEDSIAIYEGTVLQAKYYNEELQDEMIIRIAHRDWFIEELGELETDVVFYQEKAEKTPSSIYIAGGDYVVEYFFSSRDIRAIMGFYEMVYSAPCFAEE